MGATGGFGVSAGESGGAVESGGGGDLEAGKIEGANGPVAGFEERQDGGGD